jgi:hypothetical protein
MSNLDGRLIEEYTAGINAPAGPEDAGKLAVVNEEGTNLDYHSLAEVDPSVMVAPGSMLGLQIDAPEAAERVALTGAEVCENLRRSTIQSIEDADITPGTPFDVALNDDTTVLLIRVNGHQQLRTLLDSSGKDGREIDIEYDPVTPPGSLTILHNTAGDIGGKAFFNPDAKTAYVYRTTSFRARLRSGFWRPQLPVVTAIEQVVPVTPAGGSAAGGVYVATDLGINPDTTHVTFDVQADGDVQIAGFPDVKGRRLTTGKLNSGTARRVVFLQFSALEPTSASRFAIPRETSALIIANSVENREWINIVPSAGARVWVLVNGQGARENYLDNVAGDVPVHDGKAWTTSRFFGLLRLTERAAAGLTLSVGQLAIWAKTDHKLYVRDQTNTDLKLVTAPALAGDLGDGIISAAKLAPTASNKAVPFVFHVPYAAGTGGAARDVQLTAGEAFNFRIVEVVSQVNVAVGASSGQLRSAAAGGGSALSFSVSTATTGTTKDTNRATPNNVVAGTPIYWRLTDGAVAGDIIVHCLRY